MVTEIAGIVGNSAGFGIGKFNAQQARHYTTRLIAPSLPWEYTVLYILQCLKLTKPKRYLKLYLVYLNLQIVDKHVCISWVIGFMKYRFLCTTEILIESSCLPNSWNIWLFYDNNVLCSCQPLQLPCRGVFMEYSWVRWYDQTG